MSKIFVFGEEVEDYDYRVINEREARASAGIMLVLGMISLFSLFLTRSIFLAEWFSITFIIEFLIRVFINPKYAPYMILGSLIVSNQTPEWVEAKPKKFAWILGMLLGLVMTYFIVMNIVSPLRIGTCLICLILLFLESAFGICLGCMLYKKLNVSLEGNCPGGVCEVEKPKQKKGKKILLLLGFVLLFFGTYKALGTYKYGMNKPHLTQAQKDAKAFEEEDEPTEESAATDKDCEVPQFAIAIGHRDMWLEHNGCPPVKKVSAKKEAMKTPIPPESVQMKAVTETETIVKPKATESKQKKSDKDCVVPQFAIDMGHRDIWLEHNGCPPVKKEAMKTPAPSESTQMKTVTETKTIKKPKVAEPEQKKSDCVAPEWAVKIGHKEMWEEHNCK